MNTKEITYEEFCHFVQGGCSLSKGIYANWDGSRHYDYIVSLECYKKTNEFHLQYIAIEDDENICGVDVIVTNKENISNEIKFVR